MSNLDDEKYRLLVDSLVANYIKQFGEPPKNDKELDVYTENIFSHYLNANDKFVAFVNRIPVNLSNVQIIDKSGRSLFIDIRNNKPSNPADKNKPKRTVRYNGVIGPRQISETNRYAFYLLLKHDFKESAKRLGFSPPVQAPAKTYKNPVKRPAAVSLEKDFKAMAAKGQASDVMAAFKVIAGSLPEKDKAGLSASLKSSGIYTSGDLRNLLNRWKDEARGRDQKQRPERIRARFAGQGPSITL
jgi:hypothetical protein